MIHSIKNRQYVFDILFILLIGFIFYFLFIDHYMLSYPDEGRYASIAQEMLMRGEWITPYQNGILFMDKPIFFYWIQIAFMKIFGINESAVRLVPVFFGLLGIVITYITSITLFNRRVAMLASFILMTSPLYFMLSHYVNMDLTVAVLISGALSFILMALQTNCSPKKRQLFCYIAYMLAGLATLTKGLIGIVFPMMIVGMWIFIFNEWKQLKKLHLLSGVLIILLLTLPWYIAMQYQHPNFFHYFFIVQHLNRYVNNGFNMRNPFYYYIIVICIGFFPWVVFFPQSGHWIIKKLRLYKQAKIEWFLVLWIVLIIIFFSIPASKISSYILPIFPPIAILLGLYLEHHRKAFFSQKSIRLSLITLSGSMLLIIIAGIFFAIHRLNSILLPSDKIIMTLVVLLILIIFIGYLLSRYIKNFNHFIVFFVISTMIIISLLYSQVHVFMPPTKKIVAVAMRNALTQNSIPVITESAYDQSFPFYVQQPLYIIKNNWRSPILLREDNWQSELAHGANFSNQWKYLITINQFKLLWNSPSKIVICIKSEELKNFIKYTSKTPYRIILKKDGFYLLTQKHPVKSFINT